MPSSTSLPGPPLCPTCSWLLLWWRQRPMLLQQMSWDCQILLHSWQNHWLWTLEINTLPWRGLRQRRWVMKMKWLKCLLLEFKLVGTGGFSSPNYPRKYPNNLEKPDAVQVKKGRILELQFTAFEIECKYDHLTITDADGTTLMEKSCGSIMPANITSTTNIINVLFSSTSVQLYLGDRRTRNDVTTGFNVSWREVEPGEFLRTCLLLCHSWNKGMLALC